MYNKGDGNTIYTDIKTNTEQGNKKWRALLRLMQYRRYLPPPALQETQFKTQLSCMYTAYISDRTAVWLHFGTAIYAV